MDLNLSCPIPCKHSLNDTKSGENFVVVQNALKRLKLTTRYEQKTVLKLQYLFGKMLVAKYCKTKILEEHQIAKKQIKCLVDF